MTKNTSPTLPRFPRLPRLLSALEARLEALTTGLEDVDVTGKGLDLIKEIKELHAILDNLRADSAAKSPPTLTIVWGCPEGKKSRASSSQKSPPRGTGTRGSSNKAASAGKANTAAKALMTDNTGNAGKSHA